MSDVLVIDDSEAIRDTLSALLTEMGHNVETASGGEEALATLARWHPRFVIIDINMPRQNGYEVAARIRALEAGAAMTLVLMTAADVDSELVAHARRRGFDHCIDKLDAVPALEALLAQP